METKNPMRKRTACPADALFAMNETLFEKAATLVAGSRYPVAFTGAGASVESGIPDFRSASGLWSRFDPMEYGTINAFRKDPRKIWSMIEELLSIADAQPNAGHVAMARMEEWGFLKGIITQNIDGLHQKAGSSNVVEFHGSLERLTCIRCGQTYRTSGFLKEIPPSCPECSHILKPDVVFFDEPIPHQALEAADQMIKRADLVIVAGTSCNVMPAATIPLRIREAGGQILEINPEPVLSGLAHLVIRGNFAVSMQEIAGRLKEQRLRK